MEENKLEKAALTVPDDVFQNPVVQERWSLTVQQIAWGLIGIAGVTLLGIFILAAISAFTGFVIPDTVVILATTVVTGCISGLVGFIAGKNSNA